MNFKEISQKLLKGDFIGLLELDRNKNYGQPSEIAKMLAGVPFAIALQAFQSISVKNQMRIFSYLDLLTQKKIIKQLGKERASYILNELSSDDRLSFYSSMKGVELSYFLEFLNESSKDTTHDLLGYPDNSVARLINY